MQRGVRIDLQTSRGALAQLQEVCVRDLLTGDLSDEAIAAVATIVRSLRGALDKTANETYERYRTKKAKVGPYYPITQPGKDFDALLEQNIPGLAQSQPAIRDAFERHQPYQPGCGSLRLLPDLYRKNHHHDFTLQEQRDFQVWPLTLLTDPSLAPPQSDLRVDGETWTGVPMKDGPAANSYIDWFFVEPRVSVLRTLIPLHNVCVQACEDISAIADL